MANDNDIIINELLCWVGNMISVLTLTQIVQYCEQKFPESVIKVAHEILHKRVITEDDKPNFVKRMSNKTGGTKSTKLMNEIYRMFQEYPDAIKKLVIVARDFTKLPVISFSGFSDMNGILLGMKSLEIQAGITKECNESAIGLIKELMVNQEKFAERLSMLEQNQSTPKASDNASDEVKVSKPFTCTECDLTFLDMSESIRHKEIHNKENTGENNEDNLSGKEQTGSDKQKVSDKGENSEKSIDMKKADTPREESHQGKSGDAMNDLLKDHKSSGDNSYTYNEKERKMNDKLIETNFLVPQSFKEPHGLKEGFGKSFPQEKHEFGSSFFSFDIENGKLPVHRTLGHNMPFPCTEWGFDLKPKANLNKHTDLHTGNKPYNAGNGAMPRKNLHGSNNKYRCDSCDKVFQYRETLEEHIHSCKYKTGNIEAY